MTQAPIGEKRRPIGISRTTQLLTSIVNRYGTINFSGPAISLPANFIHPRAPFAHVSRDTDDLGPNLVENIGTCGPRQQPSAPDSWLHTRLTGDDNLELTPPLACVDEVGSGKGAIIQQADNVALRRRVGTAVVRARRDRGRALEVWRGLVRPRVTHNRHHSSGEKDPQNGRPNIGIRRRKGRKSERRGDQSITHKHQRSDSPPCWSTGSRSPARRTRPC